jgi:glutathione peroxidase
MTRSNKSLSLTIEQNQENSVLKQRRNMKKLMLLTALFMGTTTIAQLSIHDFEFETLDGTTKSFADFKGKKILIVNTASECGFTPQYEALQELHESMGDKLVIIGFPANNFGGQEPGTNEDISAFCKKNYGVTFTMAAKVSVKGDEMNKIFKWLCSQKNENFTGDINWNFEKFLLNEKGELINRFRSSTKPMAKELTAKV